MRIVGVTHSGISNGALFGSWVEAAGHEYFRWSIREQGTPPPEGSYDAVVIYGGGMNVGEYDKHPWLRAEEEFIRGLIRDETPLFAICLGAQTLAHLLGGQVYRLDHSEILWHPIELTGAGLNDPLLSLLPEKLSVLEWHHYAFRVPPGIEPLACSARCVQAFRVGEAPQWGVQFHPDGGRELINRWLESDFGKFRGSGAKIDLLGLSYEEAAEILHGGIDVWEKVGRSICERFLALAAEALGVENNAASEAAAMR